VAEGMRENYEAAAVAVNAPLDGELDAVGDRASPLQAGLGRPRALEVDDSGATGQLTGEWEGVESEVRNDEVGVLRAQDVPSCAAYGEQTFGKGCSPRGKAVDQAARLFLDLSAAGNETVKADALCGQAVHQFDKNAIQSTGTFAKPVIAKLECG
jgi:hypothetical protein